MAWRIQLNFQDERLPLGSLFQYERTKSDKRWSTEVLKDVSSNVKYVKYVKYVNIKFTRCHPSWKLKFKFGIGIGKVKKICKQKR